MWGRKAILGYWENFEFWVLKNERYLNLKCVVLSFATDS